MFLWLNADRRVLTAFLLRLLEILILKNIWRCANQPEAYLVAAGVARGKSIPAQHDDFVRRPVGTIVNHLIDARFTHSLAGAEQFRRACFFVA